MKIAHISDLHLGHIRYRRERQGVNQRDIDVALAFHRAVDDIIAQAPDVVAITGDVFDKSHPNNLSIVDTTATLWRLRRALPDVPILLVAGNHDLARVIQRGILLPVFREIPGVTVATDRVLWVEHQGVPFCLVPTGALSKREAYAPRPGAVLLIHAGLTGRVGIRSGGLQPSPETIDPNVTGWSYVGLGDWHVAQQVGRRAWYAGSIEYTSSNPWGELKDEITLRGRSGKGWLLVTLTDGDPLVQFRQIPLARRHLDFPVMQGAALTAAQILAGLERLTAIEQTKDAVVRQVVFDVPRVIRREVMAHALVRSLKLRCLHFNLDLRAPAKRSIWAPGAEELHEHDLLPWEREQAHAARYWEPKDYGHGSGYKPLTPENIAQQANGFVDPYT